MKAVNFWEVIDYRGDSVWGGESALQAIEWFRRGLDRSIYVSVWDEADIEEPRLLIDKIEVTKLVLSALASGRG